MKHKQTFHLNRASVAYILLVVVLSAFFYVIFEQTLDREAHDRDGARISDINEIRFALRQYRERTGSYPPCLYQSGNCVSLEGSAEMNSVPVDPLTNSEYGYAASGVGARCTGYHVGISLERTMSQALLTGSDAPPKKASELCRGSAPDFSGLSYSKGGEQCGTVAGIAQPTDDSKGETCYDLRRDLSN